MSFGSMPAILIPLQYLMIFHYVFGSEIYAKVGRKQNGDGTR